MILPLLMILLVFACFLAAILNLAMESRVRAAITSVSIAFAVACGVFFYGYGYAVCQGVNLISLLRALLAVCRMFAGVNDLSSIQTAPLMQYRAVLAIFWLAHFLAFYVTASTAIATLGDKLLRRIRTTLLRRGPLLLIYGVNAGSVAFAQHMRREHRRAVLFVDRDCPAAFESAIRSMGAVLDKSGVALKPSPRFLRRIRFRPGSRRLELAALHADGAQNLSYARELRDAMRDAGIHPTQCSLLASGIGGEDSAALQARDGAGYGTVFSFDEHELTSRLLLREHPPCEMLRFDGKGRATEDFHAVMVGFGRTGQALLAQLLMNAQFNGSRFRVDIFDSAPQNGFLHAHALTKYFDIRFHKTNGRSEEFYDFLEENAVGLRCLILCTGKQEENREIAEDIAAWFRGSERPPYLLLLERGSYTCIDSDGRRTRCANIYDSEVLDVERLDGMAMEVNHIYQEGSTRSAAQDWQDCDYFSRMSCRAAADYFPALLRAAGKTEQDVLRGDWPPEPETMENLAAAEHLRWCAFHYVMGFSPMPEAVYEQRAAAYRREREEKGRSELNVTKDTARRRHACLIPWEELDALSSRQSALLGRTVDFKQMDRNNVMVLCRALAACAKGSEGSSNG